jgi:hypothetical protein
MAQTGSANGYRPADCGRRSVAPFYRKNFLRWIDQAKRSETRAARIAEMVKMLEGGKLKG